MSIISDLHFQVVEGDPTARVAKNSSNIYEPRGTYFIPMYPKYKL